MASSRRTGFQDEETPGVVWHLDENRYNSKAANRKKKKSWKIHDAIHCPSNHSKKNHEAQWEYCAFLGQVSQTQSHKGCLINMIYIYPALISTSTPRTHVSPPIEATKLRSSRCPWRALAPSHASSEFLFPSPFASFPLVSSSAPHILSTSLSIFEIGLPIGGTYYARGDHSGAWRCW